MEFICVYPSGLEITKNQILDLKDFRKIVMNYLKINRLYSQINKF